MCDVQAAFVPLSLDTCGPSMHCLLVESEDYKDECKYAVLTNGSNYSVCGPGIWSPSLMLTPPQGPPSPPASPVLLTERKPPARDDQGDGQGAPTRCWRGSLTFETMAAIAAAASGGRSRYHRRHTGQAGDPIGGEELPSGGRGNAGLEEGDLDPLELELDRSSDSQGPSPSCSTPMSSSPGHANGLTRPAPLPPTPSPLVHAPSSSSMIVKPGAPPASTTGPRKRRSGPLPGARAKGGPLPAPLRWLPGKELTTHPAPRSAVQAHAVQPQEGAAAAGRAQGPSMSLPPPKRHKQDKEGSVAAKEASSSAGAGWGAPAAKAAQGVLEEGKGAAGLGKGGEEAVWVGGGRAGVASQGRQATPDPHAVVPAQGGENGPELHKALDCHPGFGGVEEGNGVGKGADDVVDGDDDDDEEDEGEDQDGEHGAFEDLDEEECADDDFDSSRLTPDTGDDDDDDDAYDNLHAVIGDGFLWPPTLSVGGYTIAPQVSQLYSFGGMGVPHQGGHVGPVSHTHLGGYGMGAIGGLVPLAPALGPLGMEPDMCLGMGDDDALLGVC
eukprot:jgi/Mesvir1/3590/Mv25313-RA.1